MSRNPSSRDELQAWLARWDEVNRVTTAEARARTFEAKFRQLETLMESADLFDWPDETADDERVRELWMRLHRLYRC